LTLPQILQGLSTLDAWSAAKRDHDGDRAEDLLSGRWYRVVHARKSRPLDAEASRQAAGTPTPTVTEAPATAGAFDVVQHIDVAAR